MARGEGRPHPCWRRLRSGRVFHDGPGDCPAPVPADLQVGDEPVQGGESSTPVGADVDLELTADTPEAGEVPPVDGGPAADHDSGDVSGQAPKATRRRGSKPVEEPDLS